MRFWLALTIFTLAGIILVPLAFLGYFAEIAFVQVGDFCDWLEGNYEI